MKINYKYLSLALGIILAIIIIGCGAAAIAMHSKGRGLDREHNRGDMMDDRYDDENSLDKNNMGDMMQSMNMNLEGKIGDEFDKAFLNEMITHHEGAVEMAKLVLTTSKRAELIKLANDIITAQTKEINMMQNWQNTWYSTTTTK